MLRRCGVMACGIDRLAWGQKTLLDGVPTLPYGSPFRAAVTGSSDRHAGSQLWPRRVGWARAQALGRDFAPLKRSTCYRKGRWLCQTVTSHGRQTPSRVGETAPLRTSQSHCRAWRYAPWTVQE